MAVAGAVEGSTSIVTGPAGSRFGQGVSCIMNEALEVSPRHTLTLISGRNIFDLLLPQYLLFAVGAPGNESVAGYEYLGSSSGLLGTLAPPTPTPNFGATVDMSSTLVREWTESSGISPV